MSRARSVADLGNQNVLDLNAIDGTLKVGAGVTIENTGEVQFAGIVTAATVQIGSATTLHSTGLDLGSGNINSHNITSTGNLSVDGNMSVGGVLTYEDVTSVDSVGIITAQSDISIADKIVHTSDTNTAIRFPAADTFTVETAGDEALRVDSSQRLLVGITDAMETFGSAAIQVATPAGGTLVLGRNDDSVNPDNGIGAIYFDTYAGGAWAESAVIAAEADTNQSSGDYPSRLIFKTTADGDPSATERLRITSDGDVGIGQITPTYKVDVKALPSASSYDGLNIRDDSNTVISLYRTGSSYSFGSVGSNQAWLYSNTGDLNITSDGSGVIKFQGNNGAERLRLRSNGDLILGPYDAPGSYTTSANNIPYEIKVAPYGWQHHSEIAAISMGNHSGSTGNDEGEIVFKTASNVHSSTTGLVERLRIGSTGQITMGNMSPGTHTLSVNGTVRIGGGDYGSTTVLSVAPGTIQWDTPGVAAGRLHATSSDNWYLNGKSYPIYTSKGVDMNAIYGATASTGGNNGNWVLLGNTQDGAPYARKVFKISTPSGTAGTFVYQVWFNGDANYEHGGLYEIRINNWSESTRFTSVAITCINGVSSGLRVYAYNTTDGIWVTSNSIWGSIYIRKFGYDDGQRSRGSTLCAVDNNGYLDVADVNGGVGTIPSGYTEVHANDSGGGGYDIESNQRFRAGQGG